LDGRTLIFATPPQLNRGLRGTNVVSVGILSHEY
jgi:hypothetical protein